MMEHGEVANLNRFDGKTAEEIQAMKKVMKKMMEAHVRQMIADQN